MCAQKHVVRAPEGSRSEVAHTYMYIYIYIFFHIIYLYRPEQPILRYTPGILDLYYTTAASGTWDRAIGSCVARVEAHWGSSKHTQTLRVQVPNEKASIQNHPDYLGPPATLD